ncbi:MucBP domain-containing protein [Listeria booriae]|uniref:LPXTG cell wall anchor domain-containing protein n=1 Tax=Listeria booriae TaxID=1552123 RepID=A0A7X1BVE7_9LIST|nr:MucBP domain-containing protein [Listeria booriae]MBC1332936.1 LPXTG cell wall anchor domain-containing protein [Listeria booriae]MBC2388336.1 LPXTG cell wall anchor domain-containing protein [Listeria booriae]
MNKRKQHRIRLGIGMVVAGLLLAFPFSTSSPVAIADTTVGAEDKIVTFPDKTVEREVRVETGVYGTTPITQEAMKKVKKINIGYSDVKSLEGLQYAVNLTYFYATANDIQDITPLANLSKLQIIIMTGNHNLTDVQSLATMTGLQRIIMDWCAIREVPDLSKLTQLNWIWFGRNQIQSAEFARNVSSTLKFVSLGYNNISDASPLANTHNADIELVKNRILDVSMLDWESNIIDTSGQEVTLPVQKTGASHFIFSNPVLSTKGSILAPDSINDDGVYQEEGNQFRWPISPTQRTGSVSFIYREKNGKGISYNSGRVTIPFEVVEAAPVTVRYVDTKGESIADDETLTGEYSTNYTAAAKDIPTYTLVRTPENRMGTYTERPQTITFVYDKVDASPVTIEYRSTTGKIIAPGETLQGKLDEQYMAEEKGIPGYTLIEKPENQQGTFIDKTQTVTFLYKAEQGAPITVQYLDDQGKQLKPDTFLEGAFDTAYHTKAIDIAHYALISSPLNAAGTFTLTPQTVTYQYVRLEGKPVIINYESKDGKTLHPETRLIGLEGTNYEATPKVIKGYDILQVIGQTKGKYTADSQHVTFIYQAIGEAKTPFSLVTLREPQDPEPTSRLKETVPSVVSLQTEVRSKDEDAETKILPHTGDQENDWWFVGGGFLILATAYRWRRM